jgi:hypothetical protein
MLQKGFDQFAKLGCRWRYSRLLSAYLDDELDAQTADNIARHLRACSCCRADFEQLRLANKALLEFEIPPMRPPLIGGPVFCLPVLKKDSSFKRLCSKKIAVPLPLAAGLSIALLVGALFTTGRDQQTSVQSISPVPASASAMIKVVEVPVDRVVNRTVYVRKPAFRRVQDGRKRITPPDLKGNIAQSDTPVTGWSDSTLKDFRPAASANLRVVKEQDK